MRTAMPIDVPLTESDAAPHPFWLRRRSLLVLWFLAGGLLLAALGGPPVRRTQEARVLETAREMLGRPARDWIVPHINGKVRLEKPPLAYWLAAAGFLVGGVREAAGRVPMALTGWLTVAAVYATGNWLFGRRAGFFSAAALLGSYLFFRHARLAETDVPANLFVTAAVYWHWKGSGLRDVSPRPKPPKPPRGGFEAAPVNESPRGGFQITPSEIELSAGAAVEAPPDPPVVTRPLYFHLGALALGLAVLAKGPPAAFAPLFFLLLVGFSGRWVVLWKWFLSGAIVTALAVALPWFLAIHQLPEWDVVRNQLKVVIKGEAHAQPFYAYVGPLFYITGPWTGFALAGAAVGFKFWRRDARVRGLLLWALAVLVPLCLIRQKQLHYLVTLVPPLALLAGWLVDRASAQDAAYRNARGRLRDDSDWDFAGLVNILFLGTVLVLLMVAPAAVIIAARKSRGSLAGGDLLLSAMLALSGFAALLYRARRGVAGGLAALGVASALLLPGVVGVWLPSLDRTTPVRIAAALRGTFADGPYCFYGPNESLTLSWALRSVVPQVQAPEEMTALAERDPRTVFIVQEKNNRKPEGIPHGFFEEMSPLHGEDQLYRVYRLKKKTPAPATTKRGEPRRK